MKLCKDCFYCDKYDYEGKMRDPTFWTCTKLSYFDLVDGRMKDINCGVERTHPFGQCGQEGKCFVDRKEREAEIKMDEPRERERGIPADRQVWEEDHESTD